MPRHCWHRPAAYHGAVRPLSADELVHESEASEGLIEDLVRIGALKPDSTGSFSSRDIARVRIAQSYISAGLSLDTLERALAEQRAVVRAGAAELVFLGESVETIAPRPTPTEAVAVRDGTIMAVGTATEIRELVGRRTRVVELDGETLLPGFQEVRATYIGGDEIAGDAPMLTGTAYSSTDGG